MPPLCLRGVCLSGKTSPPRHSAHKGAEKVPPAFDTKTPAFLTLSEPLPNLRVYKLRAAMVRGYNEVQVTVQVTGFDKWSSCGNSKNKNSSAV